MALNPGVVTIENADAIIGRIESARNSIEGNAEVLAWLRGDRTVYVESEKRARNVVVVDFEHASNNTFHVTDEWEYTNGQDTNRADVVRNAFSKRATLVKDLMRKTEELVKKHVGAAGLVGDTASRKDRTRAKS